MTIPSPPGVFDILPSDPKEIWRSSHLWNYLEALIRETALQFGYREIRTPIFERTELFQRGVGETSDIVSKEMYIFEDKGKRSMALRPEGTAPAMRAVIENQLCVETPIQKLFYIGPMFRYDRPQAGRYRQHHQFGAEAIGNGTPEQDVELIDLIYTLYRRLGLKELKIAINSIGDTASRLAYRDALLAYLRPHAKSLSEDSQRRLELNPLRILDSKDPKDREISANAPAILDFLNKECQEHFARVKELLQAIDIPFEVAPRLVRGLDYYNKTVFEIVSGDLGAQNSIGGGGRYDGLLKQLGGPDLPAIGFGTGLERILQTMINQKVPLPHMPHSLLFLIPLGEAAQKFCFKLLHELRQHHISVQMDFSGRKLNKIMQYANSLQCKFTTVIGENELSANLITLKEMATGKTYQVHLDNLIKTLEIESKSKDFIDLYTKMSEPFANENEAEFFEQKISQALGETTKLATEMEESATEMKNILKKKKEE